MSVDTSWREEYLQMKSGLDERRIRLLKEGPWSLSSSWLLGAMHGDWKRMKGIVDPPPPNCQSTLTESLKKMEEMYD
tara:strand:- start:213 stop:443 length:231 start_codon:yes stop_codon:yes gene_type:complete